MEIKKIHHNFNAMLNMMLKQLFKITASCAVVLALSVTVHAQPIVELADNLSFEGPVPTVSVITLKILFSEPLKLDQ